MFASRICVVGVSYHAKGLQVAVNIFMRTETRSLRCREMDHEAHHPLR